MRILKIFRSNAKKNDPGLATNEETSVVSVHDVRTAPSQYVSRLKAVDQLKVDDFRIEFTSHPETLFLVPYLRIKIYCHSEQLDKMNDLSLFVLDCIDRKVPIEEIKTITNLKAVIDEEIEYLKDLSLIEIVDNKVTVTPLGTYYSRLVSIIKPFRYGIEAYLNLFNNKIDVLDSSCFVEPSLYPEAYIIENVVLKNDQSYNLLKNENYQNSKMIIRSKCESAFDELVNITGDTIQDELKAAKADVLDSIYTTIGVGSKAQREIVYRLYQLDYDTKLIGNRCITLYTEVLECSVLPKSIRLDSYRDKMDSIMIVGDIPRMLSAEGMSVINEYNDEKAASPFIIRKNKITNIPVINVVKESELNKNYGILKSDSKVKVYTPKVEGIRFTWSGSSCFEKIDIPFDSLTPVDVENSNE